MKEHICNFIRLPRTLTERHPKLKWCVLPFLLLFALGVLYAVQWITMGNPVETLRWVFQHPGASLLTVLVLTLAQAAIWGLTGSLFAAGLLTLLPPVVLGFVNYYKMRINGSPVEISDFALAKNLSELTTLSKGNLSLPLRGVGVICLCLLMLLCALWLDRAMRLRWQRRLAAGIAALALLLGLCGTSVGRLTALRTFHMQPDSRVGQSYSNSVNGVLGGLFRSWALKNGTAPKGYDQAYMQEVLARMAGETIPAEDDEEKPSVILVLSESFFDMTTLPNVEFSADPLPVFRSLSEQTVSGTFYTSYCGYYTGIIERSILTGLHSRYLPYGVNTCYMSPEDTARLTALPALFRENGYRTLAMHTYNNELYNRVEAFPLLGFDKVLFQDDFYDETRTKGGYLSDDYFADLIISNYEDMTADGSPAFVFGISMENHQPYPVDKFDETEIKVSSPLLAENELGALETVAQGIYDADASLGKLVDYFSSREDKVILVFFGDHRPSLPTADNSTIYQKLGACANSDDFYWTPEEKAVLYSTDYLAWANYDAFDEMQPGKNVYSGDMLLGSQVLRWAGLPQTAFWRAVAALDEKVCSYTEYGFVAADGTPSRTPTEEASGVIADFEAILYDTFYGARYITDDLNRIG